MGGSISEKREKEGDRVERRTKKKTRGEGREREGRM